MTACLERRKPDCKRLPVGAALRMIRLAMLPLVLAMPWPARAAVLDEFLARGYGIAAATVLPGSFTGCVRQHRLLFADGSVFACARTMAQTAYEPRVYILRLGGEPPSVMLVGSRGAGRPIDAVAAARLPGAAADEPGSAGGAACSPGLCAGTDQPNPEHQHRDAAAECSAFRAAGSSADPTGEESPHPLT